MPSIRSSERTGATRRYHQAIRYPPRMNQDTPSNERAPEDLGFTYRARKNGDVEVLHKGRLAASLRGVAAQDFLAEVESGEFSEAQQLMARLTGNYKHGNERSAKNHPRNRG